ncbi:taste receptor type 2 member 7-like [Gracilinanus agilis]|uniref:taste receptor type 2 member 7-like n=1 Tax=Gracilinanus agilis TaxID=191870 RepID=UPI001CFF1229|nr:taste receptor type 2 member 7-like [Gracilinanus agilis]
MYLSSTDIQGPIKKICVMLAAAEFLVGGLANGFIGLVNFIDWVKTRRVYSIDLILTVLAVSRIIFMGSFTSIIIMNSYLDLYADGNPSYLEHLWNLSNHVSSWFGTCLSIFYFLKITTFSHPAFLWLKWRINKVVLGMMVISFLISLLINLPMTEKINEIYKILAEYKNKANGTHKMQINKSHKQIFFFFLIFYHMEGFFPFGVSIISCFLLVFSLWRHTQQITASRNVSTEVHKKTMKSMVSFLFLYLLYHLGIIMANVSYVFFESTPAVFLSMLIAATYPLAHSIILIKENNKLRQAFLSIVWQLKHCF